jgi:hypothetical protein
MVPMGGCHPLTDATIDEEVTRASPGSYALGYLDDDSFVPFYVGRSDVDVRAGLHCWVGMDSRPTRFGPAAKAAYGSRQRRSLLPATPALSTVGVVVDGRYTHFVFRYAPSAETAFRQECQSYHDFGGSSCLDNERHPAPPEGGWSRCREAPCA